MRNPYDRPEAAQSPFFAPASGSAADAHERLHAATTIEWQEISRILEFAELFWISTIRPDGRPHVTPVVAVWVDDMVWSATGTDEQKFSSLRANPIVVLATECDQWDRGIDVVVEGKATQVIGGYDLTIRSGYALGRSPEAAPPIWR